MVASNVAEPPAQPRKKKPGERGPEIPVLLKLQARALYLNEGLPYRAISDRTGIPVETLHPMASKEGWVAARRAHKARLIASQDAKGDELRAQVEAQLAERAVLISQKALNVTEKGLDQGDLDGAKQAQAASSALKNLVTSARVLQNPGIGSASESSVTNFNLFFAPSGPKPEVQVTEVEAKSVQ